MPPGQATDNKQDSVPLPLTKEVWCPLARPQPSPSLASSLGAWPPLSLNCQSLNEEEPLSQADTVRNRTGSPHPSGIPGSSICSLGPLASDVTAQATGPMRGSIVGRRRGGLSSGPTLQGVTAALSRGHSCSRSANTLCSHGPRVLCWVPASPGRQGQAGPGFLESGYGHRH